MAESQFDPIYTELPNGAYLKHLELIQGVVSRMAANQFQCKTWSAAIVGAMVGFAVDKKEPLIAAAAVIPALVFWGLDAWFLDQERRFRELYNAAIARDPGLPTMSLNPYALSPKGFGARPAEAEAAAGGDGGQSRPKSESPKWSPAVLGFHLPFVAAALAATVYLWCGKACS
jgi:hypothetical protein